MKHLTDVKVGHKVEAFRKIKGAELPPFNVVKVDLEKSGIIIPDETFLKATIFLDDAQRFALYQNAKIEGHDGMVCAKDEFSIEVNFETPWNLHQEEVIVQQTFDQHDEKEIFQALNDYWFQFWKRDPTSWDEEVPLDSYIPQLISDRNIFVNVPPIDELALEDWKFAIHQAKSKSSPGIDGITFGELKQLPDSFVAILAKIVSDIKAFPKDMMVARTVPLPKVEGIPFAKDSRPITVLPTIYRIWSRLIATKLLQVLGATLPPQVTGMLPTRGAMTASYNFQFILEKARALQQHLSGVTLDLRKCFNLISRQKLQSLLIGCGLPIPIVKKWISSLQAMQRFWQVGQVCSPFFETSTGCPEGDSLSVVAMICIAWLWIEGILRIDADLGSTAYADNWTWWTTDPLLHSPAFTHTIAFTGEMGLEIDWQKTWRWETSDSHAEVFKNIISQFVPTGKLDLMTNAWDLGTPIAYKAMNKLGKIKQRFDKAKARLSRIQSAPWDFSAKVHVILAAVYTVAFYACEVTCIGQQHLEKFRSAIAQSLIGDSAHSMSPAIFMHCAHAKLLDPGLFVILQSLKAARKFLLQAEEQDRQLFLYLASRPSEYVGYAKGPASALREYLLRLGWTVDKTGMINVSAFLRFDILHTSFQRFVLFAIKSWQETLIVLNTSRFGLFNLRPISRHDTLQQLDKFESTQRILLLREIASAFQTNVQKSKWTGDTDDTCDYCNAAKDTKFHRCLECPCFDGVRQKHQQIVEKLKVAESSMPDLPVVLQHPNEEFLMVTEFCLSELIFPEQVKTYCENATFQINFYTDGSCKHQSDITSRFATYCVVIDWCQTDAERIAEAEKFLTTGKPPLTLQIVGLARCSGEQSIARAELFAITRCFEDLKNFIVYTDSQFALNSVNVAKNSTHKKERINHSQFDLVERLSTVCQDSKSIQKIKAHQNPCDISPPLARYHVLGNMVANDGAIFAIDHLEPSVANQQKLRHEELQEERADVVAFYKLLLDLQMARAQTGEADESGELNEQIQTPQRTLRDDIVGWSPLSEWQIGNIDKQWLVHSAWGHSVAESVVQWFQHCQWPNSGVGPQGQSMGISWTEVCLAIVISHGGWLPVRRGKGNNEQVVQFHTTAEAISLDSNLAEQTVNTWKIVQHIQSLTPQRLWPSEVGQGKVSSLYLLGNPIFTTGFTWRPAFPQQGLVFDILTEWFKKFANIQVVGLPHPTFERALKFTDVDQQKTSVWSSRNLKAQNAMKVVNRARKTLEV